MSDALDVGDVEALDAARLHLEVEQVAQAAQDLLGLLARMLPLEVEGDVRVAHHQLEQPHLLPALGHADADLRAAPLGQPRLEQLAVRDLLPGASTSRGTYRALGVELLHRVGQQPLRLRHLVQQVPLAADHLAVAHREHLQRGALPLDVGAEQVPLVDVGGGDLLRRLQPLEGADLVAQAGRLLEAIHRRRRLHLALQPLHDLVRAPLEEQPRVVHRLAVPLRLAHLDHARRQAAADLVLQARPRAPPVQRLLAGADAEDLVDEAGRAPSHRRPGCTARRTRPRPRPPAARRAAAGTPRRR